MVAGGSKGRGRKVGAILCALCVDLVGNELVPHAEKHREYLMHETLPRAKPDTLQH